LAIDKVIATGPLCVLWTAGNLHFLVSTAHENAILSTTIYADVHTTNRLN